MVCRVSNAALIGRMFGWRFCQVSRADERIRMFPTWSSVLKSIASWRILSTALDSRENLLMSWTLHTRYCPVSTSTVKKTTEWPPSPMLRSVTIYRSLNSWEAC